MKIALCPLSAVIGDFSGNLERVLRFVRQAAKSGADLAVFPELSLSGYPAQELWWRPGYGESNQEFLNKLQSALNEDSDLKNIGLIVGAALPSSKEVAQPLVNAAVFITADRMEIRTKQLLPAYDIFFENRYFHQPPMQPAPIEFAGSKIGLLVCEDSWHELSFHGRKQYNFDPAEKLKKAGAEILINISASPFSLDKRAARHATIAKAAKQHKLPVLYVNQLGANDELVFDGEAFAYNNAGDLVAANDPFDGKMILVEADHFKKAQSLSLAQTNEWENLRLALQVGIRDYVRRNGFKEVVLGLSGGIDSALVAVLAAEAIGPENVIGISMPSKHSSSHSLEDAEALATRLGIRNKNLPIKFAHSTLALNLRDSFRVPVEGITDENLQSRLRGLVVMAFANRFNALALATGNKSEFAMGYSTLYGDMCGALAPIGDLYKTQVYGLAKFINKFNEIIPQRTIDKAPSAELRPNQTDQDSLPPYEALDACLKLLIEEELSADAAFAKLGKKIRLTKEEVSEIYRKLRLAEYKRRQAPPILRMSERAFGPGRPYPLTAHY